MQRLLLKSLRYVFSLFSLEDLDRLFRAHLDGRTVRGQYATADGKGCLLNILSGGEICSRKQLRLFFASRTSDYLQGAIVIAAFDNADLPDELIADELFHAIQERIALNAAEQRTVDAVCAGLPRSSERQRETPLVPFDRVKRVGPTSTALAYSDCQNRLSS